MIHPDDQYYEPLSPKLVDTLCDIANGLTNSEIGEKHHISKPTSRFDRLYSKLGVQGGTDKGVNPPHGIYSRLKAALKATRIGLIIYDYETSQYVPNPDFKQPDRAPHYLPPRKKNKKKILTVDSFSDDKVGKAKEALLSGEMPPSSIVDELLKGKQKSWENYRVAKQKLTLIKEELKSQGYTVPKYRKRTPSADRPWKGSEKARIAEIKERDRDPNHELVPIVRQFVGKGL